jgi:release factor glutamine methyltransferase
MMAATPLEPCPHRVGDALRWAVALLVARGTETPRLDAELLLAHVLDADRPQVLTRRDNCLTPAQAERFTDLVRRRVAHEPVAYLLGERAFFDVTLRVTPATLIPRPETEHLVEEALAWARTHPRPLRVVDVGTGSGAIAIVLARHLPEAFVWAIDVSLPALQVAAENVRRYALSDRVQLVQADLLTAMSGPMDLIVANLPYVPVGDMAELEPNVRLYEPHLALEGGADGTEIMMRLIEKLLYHLACPGLALFEIDPRQAEPLRAIVADWLRDARVSLIRDLAGHERVLRIERDDGE